MITRAIALLIVVGDDEIRNKDRHWQEFIQYVEDNEGMLRTGLRKKTHPRIEAP